MCLSVPVLRSKQPLWYVCTHVVISHKLSVILTVINHLMAEKVEFHEKKHFIIGTFTNIDFRTMRGSSFECVLCG